MRRSALLASTLVTLLGMWTACGGSSTPPHPTGAAGGPGSLIATATDGSLVEIQISGGSRRTLIRPEPGGYLLYPSVSLDGSHIAYVSQAPPGAPGTAVDSGFDLWTANRDGTEARVIFRHDAANQQVILPQWLDPGHLLAIVQERGQNGVVFELERIDAGTGERQRILDDVLTFGVSRDGSRIAFAKLDSAGLTLSTAASDGSAPRVLLSPKERLSPFSWPRYSPDGAKLAFTAAESQAVTSRQRLVSLGPVEAPLPDGAPQDVWEIDAGGGVPNRLADLKEDNPSLTWGGDGRHIYANGTKGLFEIDVSNGAVRRVGDGTFHGQISWAP